MKSTRIRRDRKKNNHLFLVVKVVLCFYLFVYIIGEISESTSAYFTTTRSVNHTVSSGTWSVEPDLSGLVFLPTGEQNIKTCPATVSVTLKNNGKENLKDEIKYEVYLTAGGSAVETGTVPPLAKGEKINLRFVTSESGTYYFTTGNKTSGYITSKSTTVDCSNGRKKTSEEPNKDEGENKESESDSSNIEDSNEDGQDKLQESEGIDNEQQEKSKVETDINNDGS
ncbi:amyloid fiber anchoring/assembly protein TapA [Ornithinibacillus bavariensis]|uniref:CARDB domain-containing protein n=1 Tax=Ornithinibacillus bavariensis TaxID=545502 RepID=A0A919X967_9BACI|nr:amyloid fiber anchoring/assembly protein TapA [Ornithinibacillus bavariensis]GIO26450.1 hypothetical protein J43TS3_10610 [Ornithinibacillus bavariensis]